MSTPVLALTDYIKEFLLETDASKEGLGEVLSQKLADRWYHPVACGSQALMAHDKNYHSTKLDFLVLKWVVTEHFKGYLLYQPFLVRTDNNPLAYIMTKPNFNATGHQWVGGLVRFNFQLEYQKGWDNTMADMLSWITICFSQEAVQSILDGVSLGVTHRAEGYDTVVVEGDYSLEKEVCVTTGQVLVKMHVTDLAETQREGPVLNASWTGWKPKRRLTWRHSWKSMSLVWMANWFGEICQNDVIHQKALYLCTTLQEHFWWPGMTSQMWQPSETAHAVYSIRAACPRPLSIPSWLLLPWISYMLTLPA